MNSFNPYQPPATPIAPAEPSIPAVPGGPEGLDGWLVWVGLDVVVTPFRMFADVMGQIATYSKDGVWTALTTPGTEAYHPAWAPFIAIELIVNVLFICLWIVLVYLFFAKKRAFPTLFIKGMGGSFLVSLVDVAAVLYIRPDLEVLNDSDTVKMLMQGMVGVGIWIPYMIRSRRVAATFVR